MYAAEYDIKCKKSKYILYIGRECTVFNTDIFVNGGKVELVKSAYHLGHKLSTINKINNNMVNVSQSQFWRGFNLFMVNLCTG